MFTLTSAGGSNNNFYLNQPDSFSFTNNKLDATGYTGALFQPVGTTGDSSQTSVTFTGNTFTGHPATYVPGDDNDVPLIINLSDVHGTVSNNTFDTVDIGVLVANGTGPLDITGNTFEHMHRAPGTSGGGFAAGVVFFQPAPFGGLVNVSNNTFTDDDAGVRTSAVPGSTVVGSPITIDGNHFTTVTNVGFQPVSGVLHFTNSTVNGPSVPSEFFGGSSDDTITSTAANDIVHGNTGTDTLRALGQSERLHDRVRWHHGDRDRQPPVVIRMRWNRRPYRQAAFRRPQCVPGRNRQRLHHASSPRSPRQRQATPSCLQPGPTTKA